MEIKLLNTVILAEDYGSLVNWYVRTFSLCKGIETKEEYKFVELHEEGRFVIALGDALEMGVKPSVPRNNCVIPQLSVSDISTCFSKIERNGGKILFGPSFDQKWKFFYGGFSDIEGNQVWVVENK